MARTSLELAFFRTFTVPTMSKILAGTGEFGTAEKQHVEQKIQIRLFARSWRDMEKFKNNLNATPIHPKKILMLNMIEELNLLSV